MTEPPNTEALLVTEEQRRELRHIAGEQQGWRRDVLLAIDAALDAIASELERYKREAHDWQDHADELSERYTAELERVRVERDENMRSVLYWADKTTAAQARLDRAVELLRRLRQWDMLNSYVGGDGERHEPTADAPYWRGEIDRVLAEIEEFG